jgi:hypothetical protein
MSDDGAVTISGTGNIADAVGYELETVDHGVVVGYDGDRPVETAMSGLTRVGNHSKYGFGELRVKSVTPNETNVKKQIEKPKSEH